MLTYSRYILGPLQLYFISIKGANIKSIFVNSAYTEGVCVGGAYIGDIYVDSISTIKYSKIYLQFRILELRPFGMS